MDGKTLIVIVFTVVFFVLYLLKTWGKQSAPEARGSHSSFDASIALLGGVVILRDNDWEECSFDGIEGKWKTAQSTRGFANVCSGRHQVISGFAGAKPALLDFVLYPGEIFIRRLESGPARFALDDPETEARYRNLARGGIVGSMSGSLVDYYMTIGHAYKIGPDLQVSEEIVHQVCSSFLSLTERALKGEEESSLVKEAYELGLTLIALPLSKDLFFKIVGMVDTIASEQAVTGNLAGAYLIVAMGLSVLPDDPFLLELEANLLLDRGMYEEALDRVERAIARDQVLSLKKMISARATKAEILASLGQIEKAQHLIEKLLQESPDDLRVMAAQNAIEGKK